MPFLRGETLLDAMLKEGTVWWSLMLCKWMT